MKPDTDLARFRATNRRLHWIGTIFVGLILSLMALYALTISQRLSAAVDIPLSWVVNWVPALFYLWALWTLRGLFLALSTTGFTAPLPVTRALSRVGWALMLGAGATLLPVINLFAGPPARNATFVVLLVPALTLFAVGLALTVLAPMLRHAIQLEKETQVLKHKLEGFF